MNFADFFNVFSFSSWDLFLKIFLLVYFLGYVIFMLVLRRQVVLMSRLFKTNSKPFLLFLNLILVGLGAVGFLFSLFAF